MNSRDPPVCDPLAGITDLILCFSRVLEMQTQILVPTRKVLFWLSHLFGALSCKVFGISQGHSLWILYSLNRAPCSAKCFTQKTVLFFPVIMDAVSPWFLWDGHCWNLEVRNAECQLAWLPSQHCTFLGDVAFRRVGSTEYLTGEGDTHSPVERHLTCLPKNSIKKNFAKGPHLPEVWQQSFMSTVFWRGAKVIGVVSGEKGMNT